MPRSGARRGGHIFTHQQDTHNCDLLGDESSVDKDARGVGKNDREVINQRKSTKGIQKSNQAHLQFLKAEYPD